MSVRLALALLLAHAAAAAPARLTEPDVRAFVASQSGAWNAGRLDQWQALFTRDATFTDQARTRQGELVPYGSSTLSQALVQARRAFAGGKVQEQTTVTGVSIAPDGRSARVFAQAVTHIATRARMRRLCAERSQTLVLTPAGLRSKGQTETLVPCP